MRITSLTHRLALTIALAMAPAFANAQGERVRVASKIDTEGGLLGNMIALVLEANNVPVERRLQLGPTKIVRGALTAGEIDIYPEYTGNAAFFSQSDGKPEWKSADGAFKAAAAFDEANKIVWLKPAPANNTWAIAVTHQTATKNQLRTMDDFARFVTAGGNVKLAASSEFVESPAALPSFQSTYQFKMMPNQLLVLSGGDTSVTIRAAAEGLNGVNAAMVYGTDGAIDAVGLIVMEDTKGAQIVYEPSATVRAEILAKYPIIKTALEPVFQTLTRETLQSLNAAIVVQGRSAQDVAREHLTKIGALK